MLKNYIACFLFVLVLFGYQTQTKAQTYAWTDRWPSLRFPSPIDVQLAPDSSNRIFVVQQNGIIRVFKDSLGTTTSRVFLNVANRITSGGETGLLGLAFHPDFKNNGYFYVNFTKPNPLRTFISRYQLLPGNPNKADSLSEKVILSFTQPYANHNGGAVIFGNDGYLYIATGDGGSGNDPENYAQNRTSLLGKILRIDVNTTDGSPYKIPADNPYVGNAQGFREEIYAYGLRNPWKITLDKPSGKIWIADVGQNAREEIDILVKGGNYGWKIMEGNICRPGGPANCDTSNLIRPVVDYLNPAVGRSVTGGYVYQGEEMPKLKGFYIYGDYSSQRVWAYRPATPQKADTLVNLTSPEIAISSFAVDNAGEIYVVGYVSVNGRLLKFSCGSQVPPLVSGGSNFCEGDSLLLKAPALGANVVGYLWSNGKSDSAIWVKEPGAYSLRLKNPEGCFSVPSQIRNVSMTPRPPAPVITQNGDTLTAADVPGATFSWFNNSGAVVGNTRTVIGLPAGIYIVQFTLNGCKSKNTRIIVTSARKDFTKTGIQVSPNPFKSEIVVRFTGKKKVCIPQASLLNQNGQAVKSYQNLVSDHHQIRMETQNIPAGKYYLSFTCGDQHWITQVIKQ